MPSVVGPIKLNSVSGGVVNFGDSFYVSPKNTGKTITGSGSANTGDFLVTNNFVSATNPFDPDVQDQGNIGNA